MRGVASGWASLLLVVLLSGCAQSAGVDRRDPVVAGARQPSITSSTASSNPDLAAQKKSARIEDCPRSERGLTAVPQGLPEVTLACLGGGREVHLAGLRGRPMLVNVWAQWCGPCRAEAPMIAEVAAEGASDLLVLGIDYVDGTQPDLAIEFARLAGWTYPQVVDPDKVLAAPLQIAGPPQTFFVRPDGTIAYRQSGPFSSADQIRALARQHLGVA